MPESRGRKPKPPKPLPKLKPPEPPRRWWKLKAVWGAVAAVMAVIGYASTLLGLIPLLSVTSGGAFDQENAYSESFTVTNVGVWSLADVNVSVGICRIETEKQDFYVTPNNCQRDIPYIQVGDPNWHAKELRRGEPLTITLTDELNVSTPKYRAMHPHVIAGWKTLSGLKNANVVVVVSYRPWVWPWPMMHGARFVAEVQPNDKVMWRQVPLSWRPTELPN